MKVIDIVIADANLKLTVVEHNNMRWVPVRPICDAIGICPKHQQQRVQRDPKFTWGQFASHDSVGRTQEMVFIPIHELEGFLFTINARSSMKPHVRDRLLAFQKGLVLLIHNSFNDQIVNNELLKPLVEIINALREENALLRSEIKELQHENQLTRQYVDQSLSSIGGKLLSSGYQKKRKLTLVG